MVFRKNIENYLFAFFSSRGPTPRFSETAKWSKSLKSRKNREIWSGFFEKETKNYFFNKFFKFQSLKFLRYPRGILCPNMSFVAPVWTSKVGLTATLDAPRMGYKGFSHVSLYFLYKWTRFLDKVTKSRSARFWGPKLALWT